MISKDKKYRVRRKGYHLVEILATDIQSSRPVLARVRNVNGRDMILQYFENGKLGRIDDSDFDLIEVREPRVIYVNEYANGSYTSHQTPELAGEYATRSTVRTAVKFVEVMDEEVASTQEAKTPTVELDMHEQREILVGALKKIANDRPIILRYSGVATQALEKIGESI